MKTFDYSLVKDPQYFKDGRMDAHSDHTYYRDGEEAKEKETSFRYDLNGIWKFHYARNYGSAIPEFEKTEYCCKDWDDIRVPAHMMYRSMPTYSIRGKVMRTFIRVRFRSILIRLQAM